MEQCFAAFDPNGDGFMSIEDFGLLCRTLFRNEEAKSYDVDEKQIKEMFDVFDLNEDNFIDVDEFRMCWQHWIKKVIEPINTMIDDIPFDHVFYTMDWHPSSHVSFVENVKKRPLHDSSKISADKAKVFDTVVFDRNPPYEQKLWPTHCVQNSWGAELHKNLKVVDKCVVIHKGDNPEVEFYSAFVGTDRITRSDLDDELKKRMVTDVFCCGIAYDLCVGKTAIDAVDLGYRTTLVSDACRSLCLEDMVTTSDILLSKSAVITDTSRVHNMVQGRDRRPELGYHAAMMLKGKLPTLVPPSSPLSDCDFHRAMKLED